MQNLNRYTSNFNIPYEYNHKWITHYIKSVKGLNKTLKMNPLSDDYPQGFNHLQWEVPNGKPLRDDYYEILSIMAQYLKVKLMWRNITKEGPLIHKVIWIIGSEERITLFKLMIDKWFIYKFKFEEWVKDYFEKAKVRKLHGNFKAYLKLIREFQNNRLILYLKHIILVDHSYDLKLQAYIKIRYKLDYKRYNTEHYEYYHAISKKFYHKRMLL